MTYEALTKAGVPLLAYGNFLTIVLNFVILAFVIFWMVRQFAKAKAKLDPSRRRAAAPEEVLLLREIRDLAQAVSSARGRRDAPRTLAAVALRVALLARCPVARGSFVRRQALAAPDRHRARGRRRRAGSSSSEQGGTIRIVRNGVLAPTPFLDIRDARARRRRAGLARTRVSSAVRDQRPLLRQLHARGRRRDGHRVVPRQRRRIANRRRSGVAQRAHRRSRSRSRTTTAARCASAPTAICTSAWATAAAATIPAIARRTRRSCSGKMLRIDVDRARALRDSAGQPVRARRPGPARDLRDRPAQSVAVQLRPRRPATCTSATSGRTRWRRSTSCRGRAPAANFGWRVMEGTQCTGPRRRSAVHVARVHAARSSSLRARQGCSVTGGVVYRGRSVPVLLRPLPVRRLLHAAASGRRRAIATACWQTEVMLEHGHQISDVRRGQRRRGLLGRLRERRDPSARRRCRRRRSRSSTSTRRSATTSSRRFAEEAAALDARRVRRRLARTGLCISRCAPPATPAPSTCAVSSARRASGPTRTSTRAIRRSAQRLRANPLWIFEGDRLSACACRWQRRLPGADAPGLSPVQQPGDARRRQSPLHHRRRDL